MSEAKQRFTEAAQAMLAGRSDAPLLAQKALEEIRLARELAESSGIAPRLGRAK